MTRPQPRYRPGDRIGGRYQVHQVKMGGMGEVYLCLDLEEMLPYALKTFQQRYQSSALRKAFEQEVATWVALEKHPNIVRCFYMDILDNQPFMVLEWIAGEEGKGADLRGWLRHSPLDLKTALEITIDVVRGLIHAQEKQPGLVHRDLKPENILVTQGGLAKITDFGLAQIVASAGLDMDGAVDGRQSLGGIAGTPAYMAPEQWRGEPLDERTDIYAIGCMLYELLTGQWPFQVDFIPTTPQQLQQWRTKMQANHESDPPPRLPAAQPEGFNAVVTACLAKSVAERPAGLTDLLARLTGLYRQHFNQPPTPRPPAPALTAAEYSNRGITYDNLKRFEQALADYNRAIALDPNYAQAYSNRGITYADLQHYDEALTDYGRAIELDPNFAQVYSNRGNTYAALQRYDEALTDYGRAIALDPNYAQAYSNRGITYAALQRYDEALADYRRAIKLDPNFAQAYSNRGTTYKDLQCYDEAIADFGWAIELDPNNAQAYYNRGTTYKDLHRYDEALADYRQAIALDPNNAPAYSNRGITYAALQRYDEALANFRRAIELDPNDTTVYSNRGITYAALQRYEEALANFGQAIELDPNNAPAYSNRGNTYKALLCYDEALADYGRAIELDPNYAQAYSNRGITYQVLQRYGEAMADYGRAIAFDPNDAKAYFNLGALLANTGSLRESLPYFEQAARLDFPQANQAIAQIRQMLGE